MAPLTGGPFRKETPTPALASIAPGPYGWVPAAQLALDELATTSTASDVTTRFGTARRVTEAILGYPVSGGHATRRAIRATGQLLMHRVGPALAVEALTWAAELASSIETSAIEAFLELAGSSVGAYRPWPLGCGPLAFESIREMASPATRKQALFELWNRSRSLLNRSDDEYWRDSVSLRHEGIVCEVEDLTQWLRSESAFVDVASLLKLEPAQQRTIIESASADEIDCIARSEHLFDLDDSIVGMCLLRATRTTLLNRSCPPDLQDRVRYPYDIATLELALRAGTGCFERRRMQRVLGQLDSAQFQHLLDAEPTKTIVALRELGFVTADALVSGRLRQLDLADKTTCRVLFGNPIDLEIDFIFEMVLRHPQAEELAWLLDDAPFGTLTPDKARRLVDQGCPSIAKSAMRHVPLERLEPSDWEHALKCGLPWMAACPGRPATDRPQLPERVFDKGWDHSVRLIWYPEELLALDNAQFGEAPGWRVSLPKTVSGVKVNAKIMQNCTASMIGDLVAGSAFLVIVHDPQGRPFNVEVRRHGDRFVVVQVNSWANGGIEPRWIRPAFMLRLNDQDFLSPWEEDALTRRRSTPNRDRRKNRARAARQRR